MRIVSIPIDIQTKQKSRHANRLNAHPLCDSSSVQIIANEKAHIPFLRLCNGVCFSRMDGDLKKLPILVVGALAFLKFPRAIKLSHAISESTLSIHFCFNDCGNVDAIKEIGQLCGKAKMIEMN